MRGSDPKNPSRRLTQRLHEDYHLAAARISNLWRRRIECFTRATSIHQCLIHSFSLCHMFCFVFFFTCNHVLGNKLAPHESSGGFFRGGTVKKFDATRRRHVVLLSRPSAVLSMMHAEAVRNVITALLCLMFQCCMVADKCAESPACAGLALFLPCEQVCWKPFALFSAAVPQRNRAQSQTSRHTNASG